MFVSYKMYSVAQFGSCFLTNNSFCGKILNVKNVLHAIDVLDAKVQLERLHSTCAHLFGISFSLYANFFLFAAFLWFIFRDSNKF